MFYFVANLKPYTYHRGRGNARFDAYLLSIDFAQEQLQLSKKVNAGGEVFCLDNGNVDQIGKFIKLFKNESKPIHVLRKQHENLINRKVRPGELPAAISTQYQALANKIIQAASLQTDNTFAIQTINAQLSFSPTYLIGMEDFSLSALLSNNVEREYFANDLQWIQPLVDRVIQFTDQTKSLAAVKNAEIYTGAHALDFDSARLAGKQIAQAGQNNIASGFAGAMQDKSFIEYRQEDNQVITFIDSAPRPYIRVMEIIAGFHLGYAESAAKPLNFHGLGLGSPILLPLMALFSHMNHFTAVDSTAPIKDAFANTIRLYVDSPAPRKLKAFRIVEFWLNTGEGWDCACPYCRKYIAQHPPNIAAARIWWQSQGARKLTVDDLNAPSPLADFIPLFGNASDAQVSSFATRTRILHNHWILKRIESRIRKNSSSYATLRSWVGSQMDVYLGLPGSNANWKQAAEIAWNIADAKSALYQQIN